MKKMEINTYVTLLVQFSSSIQSKQSGKPSHTDKVDINVPSSHLYKVTATSNDDSNLLILILGSK